MTSHVAISQLIAEAFSEKASDGGSVCTTSVQVVRLLFALLGSAAAIQSFEPVAAYDAFSHGEP